MPAQITESQITDLITLVKGFIQHHTLDKTSKEDTRIAGHIFAHKLFKFLISENPWPRKISFPNLAHPPSLKATIKANEYTLLSKQEVLPEIIKKAPDHIFEWYAANSLSGLYLKNDLTMPYELRMFTCRVLNGYYEKIEKGHNNKYKKYDFTFGRKDPPTLSRDGVLAAAVNKLISNEHSFRHALGIQDIKINPTVSDDKRDDIQGSSACEIVEKATKELNNAVGYDVIVKAWRKTKQVHW